MTAGPLRVVVVDDHPMFRKGLAAVLETMDGVEVVGAVGTGTEAVETCARLTPDAVFMDLHLPGLDGIEATRRVVAAVPGVAVVVLTMVDDEEAVVGALRAGARGYLLKGADQEEIGRAVAAVRHGGMVLSGTAGSALVRRLRPADDQTRTDPGRGLTDREREVLALLAQGRSNDAIAVALHLSGKTVRNYVSSLLVKLGADSRAHAVAIARDHHWGTSPGGPRG